MQQTHTKFETVLEKELELLRGLRHKRREQKLNNSGNVYRSAHNMDLAGLAFSGGGIRSATFNLGVIQALARAGFLSKFDYLSTVSGGGYIGSWLTALLHRKALKASEKKEGAQESDPVKVTEADIEKWQALLKTHPSAESAATEVNRAAGDPPDSSRHAAQHAVKDLTSGFPPVEPPEVRYLRGYSNYISPRLGLSGDALAVISIFLRNLVLLQLTLFSLVALVLILAYLIGTTGVWIQQEASMEITLSLRRAGLIVIFLTWFPIGRLRVEEYQENGKAQNAAKRIVSRIVLPVTLGCVLIVAAFVPCQQCRIASMIPGDAGYWILGSASVYFVAWALGFLRGHRILKKLHRNGDSQSENLSQHPVRLVLSAVIAGAVLGALLYGGRYLLRDLPVDNGPATWLAMGLGPPLMLLVLSFVVTLHIGTARDAFSKQDREWWARLGGFVLLVAAGWALVFVIATYSAPTVHWLAGGQLAVLITWAAGSGSAAWLAGGPATGDSDSNQRWKEMITRVGPWIFVTGLVVIVAQALFFLMTNTFTDGGYGWPASPSTLPAAGAYALFSAEALSQLATLSPGDVAVALVGAAVLFIFFSWALDINIFSAGALYSNRLTRAYLGASRTGGRRPHPFTGFDKDDDLPLHKLARQRPIPILNTSINMTGGDSLAWQTRRAASFAFTPNWAGYECKSTQCVDLIGYRSTSKYAGGLFLGTVVGISGAAASPNMGYHTSPSVAALLTAFNIRLGFWGGNTRHESAWKEASPFFAARPLIAELTGSANARAKWINLTDGGHFDNLGIYELVRRRCRLILVTDAGCDPEYHLTDLSNAVRKCWTDFGVDIRLPNLDALRPDKGTRFCKAHGVVGRIRYPDGEDGAILYLKSSLTGSEWVDIREYAEKHRAFPHESTVDQFFDEDQFEAYRHLGFDVAVTATRALKQFFERPDDLPTDLDASDIRPRRFRRHSPRRLYPQRV